MNPNLSPPSRRTFVQRSLAALTLSSPAAWADGVSAPERSDLVCVGSDGGGLRAVRFEPSTGQMRLVGLVADLPRPRWVLPHPRLPVLYVAVDANGQEGRVLAYTVDRHRAALTAVSDVTAGGAGTTHLWLDHTSATLFGAQFGAGSVSSFAVLPDGRLGERVSTLQATGSGPHRRQASAHAHGSALDPSGRFLLVPDLGADRVFVHGFDPATRLLAPEDAGAPRAWVAPAGSGPRRAVFGASGRFVYVLSELTAEVTVLRWEAATGRLVAVQVLSLSSPDFKGARSASELVFSRDGRFAYVGDRGEGALVVYSVHTESGELTRVQRLPSGGERPWALDLHASGRWLLVANHGSHRLTLFGVDPGTGELTDSGRAIETPGPVSVAFVY